MLPEVYFQSYACGRVWGGLERTRAPGQTTASLKDAGLRYFLVTGKGLSIPVFLKAAFRSYYDWPRDAFDFVMRNYDKMGVEPALAAAYKGTVHGDRAANVVWQRKSSMLQSLIDDRVEYEVEIRNAERKAA